MTSTSLPALEVVDIHKRYGDHEVLKGIDLTARDGDVISIIGSSGSGKSTFLRCINLLEQPSRGEIRLRGETLALRPDRHGELQAADRRQLERMRARIGFVFQNFNLWPHMTILDNLTLAPMRVAGLDRKAATERAEALLVKVGLQDKRKAYPGHLSGGQQQRVAIARTLAMEPEVLLFDEPTSALDPELVNEVLGVMRALAEEGRTMLIVTHEMRFARDVSTQVMFLHQGRVEEFGPPARVFSEPESARCREFLSSHL
ncbi:MAG: ATP-binding cassette domain-containing protein [Rhodocyclaceae bacterium]|jgi:polar amino acid transport system ATP-binding protein|nr:ATP-binding cassette domain-containing protein [Rhodocyclaceae bacterium]MCL4758055.1 ATP-binding cassette domain-containing protein [Rhodocyclaceae bacterium]